MANNAMPYVTGFGSFSSFLSSDRDRTTVVFKRFDKLALRDLLYYQSELAALQEQQDRFDREDAIDVKQMTADWDDIRVNARDWTAFSDAAKRESGNARWKERMELAMRIRETLKTYREALVLESKISSLRTPSKQTKFALSQVFHSQGFNTLTRSSSSLYPKPGSRRFVEDDDYVGLAAQEESDVLSHFLKTHCTWLFSTKGDSNLPLNDDARMTHAGSAHVRQYSHSAIESVVYFVSAFSAVVMLLVPIYSLYHVSTSTPGLTMGLIGMFTLLFALVVALLTNARRAEIFGSTAAYAAVLVVFVSGNFASGGGGK